MGSAGSRTRQHGASRIPRLSISTAASTGHLGGAGGSTARLGPHKAYLTSGSEAAGRSRLISVVSEEDAFNGRHRNLSLNALSDISIDSADDGFRSAIPKV